eukprot:gb/GFBE01073421.1/.p1 GENE.gb/GFBE01073421.1/~~gb/GFBE01073421.1/.p1  ORF type:complete len:377 (+),score=54.36 gb/GFBE01073421.1/:1-1131(+)
MQGFLSYISRHTGASLRSAPAFSQHVPSTRLVTVWAAQQKLKNTPQTGMNSQLQPDTPEKRKIKASLNPHFAAERAADLSKATAKIVSLKKQRKFQEGLAFFQGLAEPDAMLRSATLDLCAKGLLHHEAEEIWSAMPQRDRCVVSYTTMIDLCRRLKKGTAAASLFAEMLDAGIKPTILTYGSMISVHSMMLEPLRALEVFEKCRTEQFPSADNLSKKIVYQQIMGATARAGDYSKTRDLFQLMTDTDRLDPEVFHFNALLTSCAHRSHRRPHVAMEIFRSMAACGLRPRVEDYTILLGCCVEDLLTCRSIFKDMKSAGVTPNAFTYQELLEAHILGNDVAGAEAMLKKDLGLNMESSKVKRLLRQLRACKQSRRK